MFDEEIWGIKLISESGDKRLSVPECTNSVELLTSSFRVANITPYLIHQPVGSISSSHLFARRSSGAAVFSTLAAFMPEWPIRNVSNSSPKYSLKCLHVLLSTPLRRENKNPRIQRKKVLPVLHLPSSASTVINPTSQSYLVFSSRFSYLMRKSQKPGDYL